MPDDENHPREAAPPSLAQNERRYQTLFETMAQGVVWQDTEGNITSANAAAERILGLTLEQMRNRPAALNETLHPLRDDGSEYTFEDRPPVKALRTGQPVLGAILGFFRTDLGEMRWLSVDAIPEIDPATGAILGAYTIFEDITDRRRAQHAAADASRRVTTILENVTDAFFALDHEFHYIYVNQRGEQLTGQTREELLGRRVWDVYPDLIGTEFYHQYHRVMDGGGPATFEAFYAGSQNWFRAHAYGTPDGLAVYLRNITHERLAEEERLSAEQRQREFMRDVLASVTAGKLCLCFDDADLPSDPPGADGIPLTPTEGLRPLRRRAEEAACSEGFDPNRTYDLITAASEAGMNAVVHAGGGAAYVRVLPNHIVQIWIVDEGPGISIENLPRATLEKGYTTAGTLGHGMKMMLRAVDRVYLRTTSSGATVVLEQSPYPSDSVLLSDW
jgi:PAS domain S-box-containing protein